MTLTTARHILIGLTLGVLLALLIAPQTRWLVQAQARSLFHASPVPSLSPPPDTEARVKAVAAQYPNDYGTQYAALVGNGGLPLADKLRTLEARFPDNASLRANILRYACDDIRWDRAEDYLITGQPVPPPSKRGPPNDPAVLAAFDRDAAAGERLDPDNAYFPYLRAVGLYAAHRDAEAQAAILRAGTERNWDDYAQDEVEGRWRLNALVYGPSAQEALARTAVSAALLFPQYAKIRAVARAVAYQAVQAEKQGDYARGIALRHALIHSNGLMRAQSPELIDALVGIAIVQVAMSRPGGVPPVGVHYFGDPSRAPGRQAGRAMAYAAFLRRHGDDSGAAQAMAEEQADQQVTAIIGNGLDDFSIVRPLERLLPWWLAGLLLLTNAVWLIVCGGAAWSWGHLQSIREAGRAPGRIIWGASAGTLAAFGILLFSALGLDTDWDALPSAVTDGLFLLTLTVAVLFLWRSRSHPAQWRTVGRGLVIGILTCAGWCGLYALVQWQTTEMQGFLNGFRELAGSGDGDGVQSGPTLEHLLAPLFALAVPLLVLPASLIRRRVPFHQTVASVAVPLACVLLLAYAGVAIGTARQERVANDVLTQSFANEGRYYAAQVGQTWPGVVD